MASSPILDLGRIDEFAEQIGGFLRIPPGAVRQNLEAEIANPGSLVAAAWVTTCPSSEDEILRFYRETESYIYALAVDHCLRARGRVWDTVVERIEGLGVALRVLVYGDGIGCDSLALAARGHRVTYFDVPGRTSAFARYRFQRSSSGERIETLADSAAIPKSGFDAAVCIEVLEHLTDPVRVMQDLVEYVRIGGRVLLTESFGSIGPDFPSHLPANQNLAGRTHQLMERFGAANTFYAVDPINYPMEFTRMPPTAFGRARIAAFRWRRAVDGRVRRVRSMLAG